MKKKVRDLSMDKQSEREETRSQSAASGAAKTGK
jgi:hypothetical protein